MPPRGDANLLVRVLADFYGIPPITACGRFVASNYQLVRGSRIPSLKRRKEPVCQIMLFHKVNDDADPFLPATPVAVFRQQMEYLARHFRIVSLDEVSSGHAYANSSFSVAITFDDGYRDNFLFAFPVLKELKIPATIYLAAGYIDTGELPWYDQVCRAFRDATAASVSFSPMGGPDGAIQDRAARLDMLARVILWLRARDEPGRAQALAAIFQQLRAPAQPVSGSMLSWDEVRAMEKAGITFGAHTMWHPPLSGLSGARLEEEVQGSKRRVEAEVQQSVRHFAYPFGRYADIGPKAKTVVQANGFETAVTTEWGFNGPQQDRFELRRCAPWETEETMFALKFDWNRFTAASSCARTSPEKMS